MPGLYLRASSKNGPCHGGDRRSGPLMLATPPDRPGIKVDSDRPVRRSRVTRCRAASGRSQCLATGYPRRVLRSQFWRITGHIGPAEGDSPQGQEGGIVRSWLDLRNFLPGLRTAVWRPDKREVGSSSLPRPTFCEICPTERGRSAPGVVARRSRCRDVGGGR